MKIQPCGAVGIVFNVDRVIISCLKEIFEVIVLQGKRIGVDDYTVLCINLTRNGERQGKNRNLNAAVGIKSLIYHRTYEGFKGELSF